MNEEEGLMAETNTARRNQAFDHKATVKIDTPFAAKVEGSWDEKRPSSVKFVLVAVGLIALALMFFLK